MTNCLVWTWYTTKLFFFQTVQDIAKYGRMFTRVDHGQNSNTQLASLCYTITYISSFDLRKSEDEWFLQIYLNDQYSVPSSMILPCVSSKDDVKPLVVAATRTRTIISSAKEQSSSLLNTQQQYIHMHHLLEVCSSTSSVSSSLLSSILLLPSSIAGIDNEFINKW